MSKRISRTKLLSMINSTEGIYTVKFKKKDGTIRKMHARQHVKCELKGGRNTVMRDDNNYLTTFDVDKWGYRTINLATVKSIKVNGEKFKVV